MPNVKISDAADAGTLLASDMLPLARSGNTNAYHATMTEIANFTNASLASGAYGNVGRNLLHNPLFNVAQRGAGPWTADGAYTADRWAQWFVNGTVSTSVLAAIDAVRSQVGDEACTSIMQTTFTGTAGAGDLAVVQQNIESVRRLGGKTVTVSFWAQAGTAGLKLGCSIDQNFGTGGSPSAPATGTGQSVTLTTGYARYSMTFAIPSTAGKTLGTNGNDMTQMSFWLTAGTTNATRSGNVGVQSGTVNIWGVQLEVGSVATPLEKPDPRYDLANCQRFYQIGLAYIEGYNQTGAALGYQVAFNTSMRAIPTIVLGGLSYANASAAAAGNQTYSGFSLRAVITASGPGYVSGSFNASADL